MEEFGRDMYKLLKMFNAKAKQLAREREKEAGGALTGGVKKGMDSKAPEQQQYAPVKLSTHIQDSIKLFKVNLVYFMPLSDHVYLSGVTRD